jgi:hypothetical protein
MRRTNCGCSHAAAAIKFPAQTGGCRSRLATGGIDHGGFEMQRVLRATWICCFTALAAGFIGCGSKLPSPAQRLPGKWHGQTIVYEETRAKIPAEIADRLAQVQYDFEFRPDGTMALSGVESGQAYSSEGRWQAIKQNGELMTIKSTEHTGKEKDINIEFDGKDTFYIPLAAPLAQGAEVAELGAMRFTRLR